MTGGQILNQEYEEYLKKRMMSNMLCTNWVCAGTFVDHEQGQLSNKRKKFLSMELDFKIDVPCVVQWSLLWFSAPTDLNRNLGLELKIKKYHEGVNGAILNAAVRPFGGEHTPRSGMLTSVARVLHSTHRKWRINQEMEGWRVRENFTRGQRSLDAWEHLKPKGKRKEVSA